MVIKNTERSSIFLCHLHFVMLSLIGGFEHYNHVRQPLVANKWSGDDSVVELAPFQSEFPDKTGHYEIRSAPWGYIGDLSKNIMHRLNNLER